MQMAGALYSALLGVLPGAPPQQRRRPLLVLGPEASGRSALLFRAALLGSSAAAAPASVMFLAPRPLQRLPCAGGLDAVAMQRIQFLYPPSSQLLFQVLANLQQTSCPTLVVVDGLEEYLSSCSGPNVAAQLVALLLDTVNHFSQKLSRVSSACQLLVSMKSPGEAGEDGGHFSVVERYFQAQMWLHPEAEESAGPVSHGATKVVRARLSQPGSQDQEWLLRFEPEGKMKISSLPCQGEDSRAQNDTPAGAEAQFKIIRDSPTLTPTSIANASGGDERRGLLSCSPPPVELASQRISAFSFGMLTIIMKKAGQDWL